METLEQLCANLEIKTGDDEDRISLLPDCVILEILSRLPTTKTPFEHPASPNVGDLSGPYFLISYS